MKENGSRRAELTSIACLEKKRKLHDEEVEIPFPKQVCRSPRDSSKKPNMIGSDESTSSNSFHTNSFMNIDDEDKADPSEKPSTSSTSWAGTTLYSSENETLTNTSTSEPESSSSKELHDCSQHHSRGHFVEFGSNVDLGFIEYEHAEIKKYTDKELEDLLYPDGVGVTPGNSYILSSGRWSVNQDTHQEGEKKMTIDKEFEQYFSMLML